MQERKLSEAEAYIMEMFWAHGPMKTDELGDHVAHRNWKPTTLLTFLSRLAGKGMLRVEKQGKSNLYTPCITREDYRKTETKAFLDGLYGGSARNLLAAMVDGGSLSAQDVAELKEWLAGMEVENDG